MRVGRKIAGSMAVLGSLLLAVSGAVSALARSGPSAGFAPVTGLKFAVPVNATSTVRAGWVFGAKAATSVTAEFKIPALTCTSTMSGVGAFSGMLTGRTTSPHVSAAGVVLSCSGGTPAAEAAVIVDNTETDDTTNAVAPGDLMKATVVTSTTKTTATIADLTSGHTLKFTRSGPGGTSFEEPIVDIALPVAGSLLPVANFGKISFSKGAVGGKAIGSVTPRTAVNMQTSTGVLQILTGSITGTLKNAFTTTFKHS